MIRGLKFYLPFLAPLLMAVLFSAYISFVDSPACAYLLGMNASLLGLLTFCFVLPGLFTIATLYFLYFSLKTRGQDFYPPSDIPWADLFRKSSGWRATILKLVGYLLPIAGIGMISLGISSFIEIVDGRTLSEMNAVIGAACEYS